MTEIANFQHDQFGQIRVTTINGDPWFLANDVCACLGLANVGQALASLDDDEKDSITSNDVNRGTPQRSAISEAGLYSLILRSRKPEAKAFKRWVTHEVLPSIRRRGGYLTPEAAEQALTDPDFIIRLATDLKTERAKTAELAAKIKADEPKIVFADAVSVSPTTILIGELAKLLRGNGVDIGQNRLFAWLREHGYLIRREGSDYNAPTQRAMDLGLFRVKETAVVHADGHTHISKTTKVTGKGQAYFINLFLNQHEEATQA